MPAAASVALRPSESLVPARIAAAGERAGMRFLEFFTANIRNPHTRRAYARAAEEFLAWCAHTGMSPEPRERARPPEFVLCPLMLQRFYQPKTVILLEERVFS